jgi:phage terminase small subunit
MALTAKMIRFAEEYIVDLNATQAAIRAGYSERTAKSIGQENLTKPDLQEYIQNLMDERSKRTEITADMVLREYAKIGFSNITDYLKVSVKPRPVTIETAEGSTMIMEDMQGVDLFDTDTIDSEKMRAVAEIKQTRDGIALKLHDKKGALDSMARHLGMFNDKMTVDVNIRKLEEYFT